MVDNVDDRAKGIDVSHWRPVKSWASVKSAGYSFVGLKATEGMTVVDPLLKMHRDGARKASFELIIYYHFARSGDPRVQAGNLVSAVGDLAPNEVFALDFEVVPGSSSDPKVVLRWLSSFFDELSTKAPGKARIIYTSRRIWSMFANPNWDMGSQLSLWVPRYRLPIPGSGPLLPAPWSAWTIWQWSDGETPPNSVPGVGPCDSNLWNGTVEDLRSWRDGIAL